MVLVVAAFLFLVNFNPFSADVLYVHMTEVFGFSEQFVGVTYTLSSAGSIVACLLYGWYSTRVRLPILVHGSIVFMILSSLVYLGIHDTSSAVLVSILFGFAYLTSSLVQLDLAARFCPPESAGTVFAALMSLINLSVTVSSMVGGSLYERWSSTVGAEQAFTYLVFIGAGFTALCWLLYRLFPQSAPAPTASASSPVDQAPD